jgi:hypothetical protein
LHRVPEELQEKIEDEVINLLEQQLPKSFPGKDLKVARDGKVYKIFGNLDLN